MASFDQAYEKMIDNEGGYQLHDIAGDRGGQTFAGIARNFHPEWEGWPLLDADASPNAVIPFVQDFYTHHFWQRIRGDFIESQRVAETLFDFAVNAGISTASKLAQEVAGVTVDGIIGSRSVRGINSMEPDAFVNAFTLKKIARYTDIVNRNPSQSKFLLGWLNRSLKDLV